MEYRLPDVLETPRTVIRVVEERDLAPVFAVYGDPEVTRFVPVRWRDMEDARQWYGRIKTRHAERSAMQFVIAEQGTGQVFGVCLLFNFDLVSERAEVGYALAKSHWGRGLAREAVERMVRFAFEDLDARRLEAQLDPRNAASLQLLERMGFQQEGLLRERWNVGGEISDSTLCGLLRREWEARHAGA